MRNLFYIIHFMFRKCKEKYLQGAVMIIFLSLAVINIFLFREGAWAHDYQLYYFLPFLAILSARGLLLLKRYVSSRGVFQIFIICFVTLFLIESHANFMSIRAFRYDIDHKIADKINVITTPDEEIGTNFKISIPTSWYSDRKYTVIKNIEEFQKINAERTLAFMILISGKENKNMADFLKERYPYFMYNGAIFFNLRAK